MQNIFIISGPSGAGEDSIINGLEKYLPTERIITTTTRTFRPGETNGNPYYFISREAFETGIANGCFVEYAKQYNDNLYGVTKDEIERVAQSGKIGFWKIDYKGVITAKRLFPDIIAIFISAPLDILESRIRRRDNPGEDYIQERMAYTKEWFKHTNIYDYTIKNEEGKLDEAVQKTLAIIQAHAKLA